jgi:ribosomal peptide maturation radical SAM protein 1
MAFRHKSPGRIVEEVRTLARRHGHRWFQFADNILSMQLFDELYPAWSSDPSTPPKFFEVKSGLKREQVRKLRQAGIVSVQAGVESFSTATLKIMRKGISAAANVSFLRWCREAGVEAHWNLIWGFPGEPLEDYNQQLALAEKLTHLDPPESCCEIRMDRFSPNHNEWKALGFTAVRPATAYQHVFPFTSETIENLAIFFDADHPCADAARTAAAPLVAHCRLWQSAAHRGEAGTFAVLPHISGGWVLIDRRFNHPPASRVLSPHDAAVLLACDEPKREESLRKHVDMPSLDALRQMEAIIELDDRLVTIPLLPDQFRTEFRKGESNA